MIDTKKLRKKITIKGLDVVADTDILRKFARACRADEYLWGTSLPGVPTEVGAAIESAIEMIERMGRIESAAQNLVKMKGRHNTEIAYQRLVAALEESK